jgi:hypothetical protein
VVEEDERADGAPVGRGQEAADHEAAAEVARMRRESLQLGHEVSERRSGASVGAD